MAERKPFVNIGGMLQELPPGDTLPGGGGGGGTWGSITGTLSAQTDLQSALDAKAAASHNHDGVYVKPADITGKLDKAGGTMTGAISFAGAQTWPTFNQNTTGSAAKLTTARTLTIGSKGYTFNGSANITWTLADIGAAATVHSHSDATTGASGFMSAADKTKLDGIAAGAQVNTVTSVAGRTGAVTIAAADVSGLGSLASKSAVAVADITATGTPGSANYLRGDGKWETPAGGGASLPSQTGQAGKYLKTDGTDASWEAVSGSSIAPGTIAYFATDPGAGWLKCDGATYLRSSYADLSAALPPTIVTSPLDWERITSNVFTNVASYYQLRLSRIATSGHFAVGGWEAPTYLWRYDSADMSLNFIKSISSGGRGEEPAFTPDGVYFCLRKPSSAPFDFYKRSGDTFTLQTAPATMPDDNSAGSCWSHDGLRYAAGSSGSTGGTKLYIYTRSGDSLSLTSTYTIDAASIGASNLTWSLDDQYVVSVNSFTSGKKQVWAVNTVTGNVVDFYGLSAGSGSTDSVAFITSAPGYFVTSIAVNNAWAFLLQGDVAHRAPGASDQVGMDVSTFVPVFASERLPLSARVITDKAPYMQLLTWDGLYANVLSDQGCPWIPQHGTFTPDGKCVIVCGLGENPGNSLLAIGRASTTQMRLPRLYRNGLQGWIKT